MNKLIPKHQKPSQPLVLSQDNTRVESPYIESIPITETALYKQYLADPYRNTDFNTWVKRQQLIQSSRKDEKVTADKRSPRVKEWESKQGEAIHLQQERKKREAEANKVIWTGIGLGGLALAQATPAAPYIDAAFAANGALGLAKQADEGTLGLNLETGLHALEMLPLGIRGAGKIQPVVSDGYKAAKNWAKAKIISSNMKVSPYRFNRGYYTIGHDWDPGAFYHYEGNILPKTLGGTRLHPLPSNLGEPKIWLRKGKPWLEGDRTLYKIPADKVKTQSSKIIDPNHAEYHVADEIDLLQDGVEISSPIYIPDKGGSLIIHGNKKFYVPTTKTTPKTVTFEPKNSNINLFKDNYGREVTPTPFPGADQEMLNIALNTHTEVLRDYFSPLKTQQIKKTMGWGDAEISELLDEILRSAGHASDVKIKGPKEGFVDIADHQGSVIGTGNEAYGKHIITLNRERMPGAHAVQEAVMHEIGGHGKTLSIDVGEFGKGGYSDMVKEYFPRLTQLTSKNEELANKLLVLNENGLALSKLKTSGDLERYMIENNLPWSQFEELNNKRKYFLYVTSPQEKYARGYTGQLYEKLHGPSTKTLNIKQLEEYYTPESVEKFKKALLGITPIAVGVGTSTNE